MDKKQLYDYIAARKIKSKDFEPYDGNNGRVNRCAQLIRSGDLDAGGTLVDVGGAIGDLGYAVRDLFDRTVVVDISSKNLEACRAKGNLTARCDVDRDGINFSESPITGCTIGPQRQWNWAEKDPCVDLITALDFIEHIIDPENFAKECFRLLKSGKQVFINTPNIRFWKHIQQLWL